MTERKGKKVTRERRKRENDRKRKKLHEKDLTNKNFRRRALEKEM